MANVELYTWGTCPFCCRAKQLLDRKGVTYTEYTLDGDEAARDAMVARGTNGRRSVPQIFINGTQFTQLAFTPTVKAIQEKYGSRQSHKRMETHGPRNDTLTPAMAQFIGERSRLSLFDGLRPSSSPQNLGPCPS